MGVYFILSGAFRYTPDFTDTGDDENINVSEWLCEACLWTPWVHLGLLQAGTKATLMYIDSSKFRECVRSSRSAVDIPSRYAMLFVQHLNATVREGYNLSDRQIPGFNTMAACLGGDVNLDDTEPQALNGALDLDDNRAELLEDYPAPEQADCESEEPLTLAPVSLGSPSRSQGRGEPCSEEPSTMHAL